MKPVNFFWLGGAAIAFVLFVPRSLDSEPSRPDGIEVKPATEGSKDGDWYADETVIERAADGHFYTQANVDGSPVLFLVDTGASVVALTGDDAYELGLDWREEDVKLVGQGASGAIYGVNTKIDEVSLGGFRGRDVPAVIIPEGLPISLLGQSFLSQVENVEIAGDRMVLSGPE